MPPTATAHACLHSTTGRSVVSHQTRPVLTGSVRRELRKLTGSPDASHRMHPERPVLTGLMRREGRQNTRTPNAEHRTHSGVSGALCTPAPQTPHRTLWSSVRCWQHQRPVSEKHSRDFSKFPTDAIGNMHFIFLKSAESFSRCANTTTCIPTSAGVLAFSQSFSSKELS